MKNIYLILIIILSSSLFSQNTYDRAWGTYFGNRGFTIKGSTIDSQGNLIITGLASDQDTSVPSFMSSTSHQSVYGGGTSDVYIAKFSPNGTLLWATYYGGEDRDFASGIAVDQQDAIYIGGSTRSVNGIATPGSFQDSIPIHSFDTGFLAKFDSNGALLWGSYYFGDTVIVNLSIYNNAVVMAGNASINTRLLGFTTPGSFQEDLNLNSLIAPFIAQFDRNGSRLWCTYYSDPFVSFIDGICTNASGIYILGTTYDFTSFYGTPNAHQEVPSGMGDLFLAKFDYTGQRIWGTYYGGESMDTANGNDGMKSISCTESSLYIAFSTQSTTQISTLNTISDLPIDGGNGGIAVVKFSTDGIREWGLYSTLSDDNSSLSISTNASDGIILSGATNRFQNIATENAYQPELNSDFSSIDPLHGFYEDGVFASYSSEGLLEYASYYGGEFKEYYVSPTVFGDGFYLVGNTMSSQSIASSGSFQETLNYFPLQGSSQPVNTFIAYFNSIPLSTAVFDTSKITVFPNPMKSTFTVANLPETVSTFQIITQLGQTVLSGYLSKDSNVIDCSHLPTGTYFLKTLTHNGKANVVKIIKD